MKLTAQCCVLILAATVISMTLRVPRLAQRPLHGDEAVHADRFGTLLEKGTFKYDPNEYHGPTLNYFTLIPAWLGSVSKLSQASEFTIRIVPVFFGVAMVLMLLLIVNALGPKPAAIAAFLTAVSPAMVFYSRYYIQEILLVCFTFGVIVSGYRYSRSRNVAWAIAVGVFLGLMHATKETCIIAYGAMFLSLVFVLLLQKNSIGSLLKIVKPLHIVLGFVAAAVVSMLFFSSFFKNPTGILDSIRTYTTYFDRAQNNNFHNHRWYYYLRMLTFFRFGDGPIWTEAFIILMAIVGFVAAVTGRVTKVGNLAFIRFIAFYTVIMTVIYSAIPYKTPWCALGFLHGMILLAGLGAVTLVRILPNVLPRLIMMLFIFEAMFHLSWQAYLSSYKYCADSRNPYVYAHPTKDVFEIANLLERYASVDERGYEIPISIICNEDDYWPIPWYLRKFKAVKYRNYVADDVVTSSIIIVSPQFKNELVNKLYNRPQRRMYMYLFGDPYYIWLRPGVKLDGYIAKDLWDKLVYSEPEPDQSDSSSNK